MTIARRLAWTSILLLASCGGAPPAPSHVAHEPPTCPPCPSDEGPPEPAFTEAEPNVQVGSCSLGWLPSGVARDVSPADTEALAALVRAWLSSSSGAPPRFELQRGIAFVKTANDEGADPPYPLSSGPRSSLECGLHAVWLRAHLRSMFALGASPDMGGITCDENVCCMAGMEFVPTRAIVFRPATGEENAWAIESTYELAEAALAEDVVAANRAYVARELAGHQRGTCRGEPPGSF
jgi:hypothetical protein